MQAAAQPMLRFADRTALSDYLMGKYDTSWGQDTASPFIMENDRLMDGWRPINVAYCCMVFRLVFVFYSYYFQMIWIGYNPIIAALD